MTTPVIARAEGFVPPKMSCMKNDRVWWGSVPGAVGVETGPVLTTGSSAGVSGGTTGDTDSSSRSLNDETEARNSVKRITQNVSLVFEEENWGVAML